MLTKDTNIDSAYPESYNDPQEALGAVFSGYLNEHSGEYTVEQLDGVVKFAYELTGVAMEHDWDGHPGWFAATRDMAYDQYAHDYAEEQ